MIISIIRKGKRAGEERGSGPRDPLPSSPLGVFHREKWTRCGGREGGAHDFKTLDAIQASKKNVLFIICGFNIFLSVAQETEAATL